MWEFYLAGSEAAFRWQDLMVFQIQLAKKNDTLPMTRDYIEKCEKALEMREMGHRQPRDCEARSPPQGGGSGIRSGRPIGHCVLPSSAQA